ncbi:methionyl-tRNA formyltransferase [Ramlibacter algicola]|uniref:methionyl-tRNA formyltransferase n=1 Tax=Ramlibacter algicola TaxID=2795217 RepID=A0A934PWQ7_9BURK|nr:methionyl-tRNA formyltransferase [Ramlibacter algicola]MBK0391894.1 methionyl-tRNA formyltransferase [Ramlibacter algicola]
MRIVIMGQNDFGRAALEAFCDKGFTVVAAVCAPEKPGAKPDPLKVAATGRDIPVHQFRSLRSPEAHEAFEALDPDLLVMAYVLQFAPDSLLSIPRQGAIQYHPSLLPRHRGPSAISWAIASGARHTGLTIFRPTEGLDEGPVLLQVPVDIGPDETLGELYFDQLFPKGIEALLTVAGQVQRGEARAQSQLVDGGSYEGWMTDETAQVPWAQHVDVAYNVIRACNPAPGAWTMVGGTKLRLFDCRKRPLATHGEVGGPAGTVARVTDTSIVFNAHGGFIEVMRVRAGDGKKMGAGDWARGVGLQPHGA